MIVVAETGYGLELSKLNSAVPGLRGKGALTPDYRGVFTYKGMWGSGNIWNSLLPVNSVSIDYDRIVAVQLQTQPH